MLIAAQETFLLISMLKTAVLHNICGNCSDSIQNFGLIIKAFIQSAFIQTLNWSKVAVNTFIM